MALSSDDLRNLTLRDVDSVIRGVTLPWQRGFEPLEELYRPGHEHELVGRQVVVGDLEGTVVRIHQGHLELRLGPGLFKWVDAAAWMRIVGGDGDPDGVT